MKQKINFELGWITGKIKSMTVKLKTGDKTAYSRKIQKQNDKHFDESLCRLLNRDHILHSLR